MKTFMKHALRREASSAISIERHVPPFLDVAYRPVIFLEWVAELVAMLPSLAVQRPRLSLRIRANSYRRLGVHPNRSQRSVEYSLDTADISFIEILYAINCVPCQPDTRRASRARSSLASPHLARLPNQPQHSSVTTATPLEMPRGRRASTAVRGAARSRSSSIAAPANADPAPSTADPDPVKEEEVSVAQDVEMAAAAPTEDFGSPRVKRRRLSEIATQDRPTGLMFGSTQDDLSASLPLLPLLHSKLAFPAIEPIGAGQSGVDVGAEPDGPVASTSTMFGAPAHSQSGNTTDLDAYFPACAKARSSQANSRLPQWFNEPIREYTPEEIEDWRNHQIDRKEQEVGHIFPQSKRSTTSRTRSQANPTVPTARRDRRPARRLR